MVFATLLRVGFEDRQQGSAEQISSLDAENRTGFRVDTHKGDKT